MPDLLACVILQRCIATYLHDLGPVLTHGRYYLQYIVRCYIENRGYLTNAQLLRITGVRYSRTPETICGCIRRFAKGVCLKEGMESYADRWRELGWDGEKALTPSYIISLVCRGFCPYMKQYYPQDYQKIEELFSLPKNGSSGNSL